MAGEIIVGYDGSGGSREALTQAIALARDLSAPLVVAYGYHAPAIGGETADYVTALRELGQNATDEAKALAHEAGAPEPEVVVESGHPADVLSEIAANRQARMVVVGSRGEHPLRGWLLGSVAHKLVHISEVPVLVVQPPAPSSD
jgi:nucleotide-binding universal stress UspA family protein